MALSIRPQVILQSEEAERLLQEYADRVQRAAPFFDGPLTNRVYALIKRVFETEGRVIGHPWEPLADSTIAQKSRINRAQMGTLRRFNTLYASLTKRSAPQGVRIVNSDGLLIGTTVPYAPPHQEGGKGGRPPQRKIIPDKEDVPESEIKEWERLFVRYLETS